MLTQSLALALALAASSHAQSTTTKTLLVPPIGSSTPAVTAIASSGDTTTYTISCSDAISSLLSDFNSRTSEGAAFISSLASDGNRILSSAASNGNEIVNSLASQGNSLLNDLTARAPQPTAAPVLGRSFLGRRQSDDDDDDDSDVFDGAGICLPYKFVQGPGIYEAQLTVEALSVTVDFKCKYSGTIGQADMTCAQSGGADVLGVTSVSTATNSVLKASEYSEYVNAVAVTLGTGGAGAASATNSGAGAQSTGAAVHTGVTREIGVMMGAAGAILGAALAL